MKMIFTIILVSLTWGCGTWPVVTTPPGPSAKGVWIGVTETTTLYNKDAREYQATVLNVSNGPGMKYPDGREYPLPANTKPVLLDPNGHPFQMPAGQTVSVAGEMHKSTTAFVPGLENLGAKPGQAGVLGIQVEGQPKQLP